VCRKSNHENSLQPVDPVSLSLKRSEKRKAKMSRRGRRVALSKSSMAVPEKRSNRAHSPSRKTTVPPDRNEQKTTWEMGGNSEPLKHRCLCVRVGGTNQYVGGGELIAQGYNKKPADRGEEESLNKKIRRSLCKGGIVVCLKAKVGPGAEGVRVRSIKKTCGV